LPGVSTASRARQPRTWPETLRRLRGITPTVHRPAGAVDDPVVVDATHDSRQVQPGWLFCCVRGERVDGHQFAAAAVAAGATALLVETPLDLAVPQLVVPDVRAAMGRVAAAVHGHPADALTMVGVTGTNGKTTVSHLVGQVLAAVGRRVEVFGTLSGAFTTPEATDLQRRLAAATDAGTDHVVMEVSSHALALHRVDGVRYDVAVFTNLGRDHLDFHGTEERYFAAKARLFTPELAERAVVNADDVHGRLLVDAATIPTSGYSVDELTDLEIGPTSHRYRWRGHAVEVPLGASFNVANGLAAATACISLGIPVDDVVAALSSVRPVPGRFESVDEGQDFSLIVDFAHTPDGLRAVLSALRSSLADDRAARIVVVFGCGGDRDRDKRPEMGEVAATLADVVVVTSDNPRSERPLAIIDAIVAGVPADYRDRVSIEPDREQAIAAAIALARPGDVVLVAGKGHETTQTIGDEVRPFDDRAVSRRLLLTGGTP
jgi:UDP-N-acetylmuramoyl-L-alanyl-D-glutamate--2,6-diaminopimelate ligase